MCEVFSQPYLQFVHLQPGRRGVLAVHAPEVNGGIECRPVGNMGRVEDCLGECNINLET